MEPLALRCEELTCAYGRRVVVDRLNLEIHPGDIYGLLGLNGAGKSTTLRAILGLLRPAGGRILIFGLDPRLRFREAMAHVGALVEIPAYYPYLSGRRNLQILRRMDGAPYPESRIEETLEWVGLAARAGERVKTYSQGMRQRLAIAMAILARPKFVILDEPTNGLDPRGILDVREMVRRMNAEFGTTFLFSSHLLPEVEALCSRVGILREGKLVVQAPLEAILRDLTFSVRVTTPETEKADRVARALPYVKETAREAPDRIRVTLTADEFPRLTSDLVTAGIPIIELARVRVSLEEYFLAGKNGN